MEEYNSRKMWEYRHPDKHMRYAHGNHYLRMKSFDVHSEMKETFVLPRDMVTGSFKIDTKWDYALHEKNLTGNQISLARSSSLHPKISSLLRHFYTSAGSSVSNKLQANRISFGLFCQRFI